MLLSNFTCSFLRFGERSQKTLVPIHIQCWDKSLFYHSCGATRLGAMRPLTRTDMRLYLVTGYNARLAYSLRLSLRSPFHACFRAAFPPTAALCTVGKACTYSSSSVYGRIPYPGDECQENRKYFSPVFSVRQNMSFQIRHNVVFLYHDLFTKYRYSKNQRRS